MCFLLWELSVIFYIFHRQSLGFNLQVTQLVGRFQVFFLSHTAPGFQLWFYFHLCMWAIHWYLASEAALEDLGLPPVRARCGGGAAAWVAGALAAPGTHGSRGLGQQEV